MISNKRIHELLEWVKSNRDKLDKHFSDSIFQPNDLQINSYVLLEILQHLLEENIEYRKIKENWESDLSIALNGFGLKKEKSRKSQNDTGKLCSMNNGDNIMDKPIEYINELWFQELARQGIGSSTGALSRSAIRALKNYFIERNLECTIRNLLNIPPEYLYRYPQYENGKYKGTPVLAGFGIISWNNLHYTLHKAGFRYSFINKEKSPEDKEK